MATNDLLNTNLKYNALPYQRKPGIIDHSVLFLATDESEFITEQTNQVRGGHYLGN